MKETNEGQLPQQEQETGRDFKVEIERKSSHIQEKLAAALRAAEELSKHNEKNALLLGIENSLDKFLKDLERCAEAKDEE